MGQKGRIAKRKSSAVAPVITTDKRLLRARRVNARSMRENHEEANRGTQNEPATTIKVRPASISISEGPVSESGARIIIKSPMPYLPAGRFTNRTIQPAGFSGMLTTVPADAASKRSACSAKCKSRKAGCRQSRMIPKHIKSISGAEMILSEWMRL